jgi:predicted O-methyltransferase YrrM
MTEDRMGIIKKCIKDRDIKGVLERMWLRQSFPYKLSHFLNDKRIIRYVKEAKEDAHINERMFEKTGYKWKDIDPLGIVVYAVIRSIKPRVVVETGVQSGISSLYILRALQINGSGLLYSIDLPDREPERVGEAVPNNLRQNWHLFLGDSKVLLPRGFEEIKMPVNIFLHDSLHTYEHMLFEFECCLKYLDKRGIIISHDILCNKSFDDFSDKNNLKNLKLYNIGFIKHG